MVDAPVAQLAEHHLGKVGVTSSTLVGGFFNRLARLNSSMHYVYFLKSLKTGRYYVGVSANVQKRLQEYNASLVKSTSPYVPWEIIKIESFSTINLAYKRERFIKSKHGRKIIATIITN